MTRVADGGELWIGSGEVEPLPCADAEIADSTWAMATVILYATSADHFLARFDEALAAAQRVWKRSHQSSSEARVTARA